MPNADTQSTIPGLSLLTIREFELFRATQSEALTLRDANLNLSRAALSDLTAEKLRGVTGLIDQRLAGLKAETDLRFSSQDKALSLAQADAAKHFAELNGEQARLLADRERFVSKDSHEVWLKEFALWRDQVNAERSIGAGRDRGIGLSWGVIMGIVGLAISVLSVTLVIMKMK